MLALLVIWAAYKEPLSRELWREKAARFDRFRARVNQRFPKGGLIEDDEDEVRSLWPEVH